MANELPNPITRDEKYLAKAAGVEVAIPYPETRNEKYLAKAGGMEIETPTPYTREEKYLNAIAEGGGGGSTILIEKDITANGSYVASDDEADGYSSVSVDVANSYTETDEGKVVSGGALVAQTSTTCNTNGTINTTTNNEVVVNVPNSYTNDDEGKVVNNGALVSQTATSASQNGTIDTTLNNSVVVNVPNSYTAGDEGKVVDNGQLVVQTAKPTEITANDVYDTTLYNSVTVNVSAAQTTEIVNCTTTMTIYGSPPNVNYFIILDRFNKKITFYLYAGQTLNANALVTGSHTHDFFPEITLSEIMTTVSTDFYTINRKKSSSGSDETRFVNSGGTYPAIDLVNNKITIDFSTNNSYDHIIYIAGFSYT